MVSYLDLNVPVSNIFSQCKFLHVNNLKNVQVNNQNDSQNC
jgi:hypothetical protein